MRTQTRPVRHKEDPTRLLPHGIPVIRPSGALESRHERLPVDLELRPRVLVRVDELGDLLHRPAARGHVERDEQHEPAADLLGGRVRVVQLRLGPVVRGPDIEREPVDAGRLGGLDLVDPLVLGLAVADADLRCVLEREIIGMLLGPGDSPCNVRILVES